MYNSIGQQVVHLLHYGIAVVLLYFLLPKLLFTPVEGTVGEQVIADFLRMTLFIISFGYILLVLKLLEVIGFSIVVGAWVAVRRAKSSRLRDQTSKSIVVARFYDVVELPHHLVLGLERFLLTFKSKFVALFERKNMKLISLLKKTPIFLVVLSSLYLRAYDSLRNPAPSMSDGYVSLAWLKYINERILFHDGIYPQGMYFFMDLIYKLAVINPLYVMKYTGPFDTTLIVIGLYYVTKSLTQQPLAGLIAAGVYGILGHYILFFDWTRQAATNSQEFGFLFIFPTLLFLHRYLTHGKIPDYWTACAGLCITGLAHPLAYILNVLGYVAMWVAHLIAGEHMLPKRFVRAIGAGVLSGMVTISPIGLGMLFGKHFNSSAASFATSVQSSPVVFPQLHVLDVVALISLLLLAIKCATVFANGGKPLTWLFGFLFGTGTFGLFYFGGRLTQSTVIVARTLDMWAIVESFLIGMGIAVLSSYFWAKRSRYQRWIEGILALTTLVIFITFFPPTPIVPYKLQWNGDVQAYLEINHAYKSTGYMLVAPNDEYALVLGDGYRMSILKFVTLYNPAKPPLTRYGAFATDKSISNDVFIYYQKKIFQVSQSNSVYQMEKKLYQNERIDRSRLNMWLKQYQRAHGALAIYYEDADLIVYHIHFQSAASGQTVS